MSSVESMAARSESVALLLGRLAIGALYLPSGWGKLADLTRFEHSLATKGLPGPVIAWAAAAAAVEFFGALAIVLGLRTRHAALAMIVFTLFAAFLSHDYWTVADAAAARGQYIHFWKDIALAGGLLFLFARGAGPLSLDRR
jgi:putative oxidoreductase